MPLYNPNSFVNLTDTPDSLAGEGGKTVAVRGDETGLEFVTASGSMSGPGSSTDNAVARFNGTGGTSVQNSAVIVDDTNNVTGMTTLTLPNTGLHLLDTDASHDVILKPGSNLTADRTVTLTTGDADRTLSLQGDLTIPANVTFSGANATTITTTAPTSITLPTTGTVATTSNKLSDFAAPTANVSMNSNKITSLTSPTDAQDAATKAYVDAVAAGLELKASCRLASTVDVPGTYVGTPTFTLTEVGFGALSVDGVTPSVGDRILLKNQTDGKQNGIWTVTVVGSAGASYVLTRATDFDSSSEILTGAFTFITAGSTLTSTGWTLITAATITLDTTSLSFTQFSGAGSITAGDGLSYTGSTLNVGAGTGITVAADTVAVDTSVIQAVDPTLTALAAYNTNGILTQTAADTFTGRTITGTNPIAVANGSGVAGNPTISLDITSLTEDTGPDGANDFLISYDASALANKKIRLSNAGAKTGFRHVGTTSIECWYSPAVNAGVATTVAATVGATTSTIYLVPFAVGVGCTIDRMAFVVTTAVADTVGRVGIYQATNNADLYPNALILDAGESSTASTGIKSQTISTILAGNVLYYMAFQFENTTAVATGPTVRGLNVYEIGTFLGTASTLTASNSTMITLTGQTYGAFPATFPAGGAVTTGNTPCAWVRLSA